MQSKTIPAGATGRQTHATGEEVQRRMALLSIVIPALGVIPGAYLLASGKFGVAQFGILAVMYSISMVGVTVGYHRLFAHRSFRAVSPVQIALTLAGNTAGQGALLFWVATHRKHHQYSDKPLDPHSPHNHGGGWRGFFGAHVGWAWTVEPPDLFKFVPDLLKNRMVRRLERHYMTVLGASVVVPAIAGWLLIGGIAGAVDGFVWGGLVRIFLVQHATWSVNSLCHLVGGRPYKSSDQSRNCAWVALPTFGEAWHNNHHAFPTSAIFGLRWYQLDLGALVIRGLRFLRLADEVRQPSESFMMSRARAD